MIKLIACDLDGTLLPKGPDRLEADTLGKIKEWTGLGKHFAFITGRDYISLLGAIGETLPDVFCYCCGGSVSIRNGIKHYSRPIGQGAVLRAFADARRTEKELVLCSDFEVFVCGSESFFCGVRSTYGDSCKKVTFAGEITSPVYKLSFFGDSDRPVYGSVPPELNRFYNRNGWEEYTARFAGKGNAFSDLCARLGLIASETAAAGDDFCDVEMLSKAGKAYITDIRIAGMCRSELITDPRLIFEGR